jgi:hypothetical protein
MQRSNHLLNPFYKQFKTNLDPLELVGEQVNSSRKRIKANMEKKSKPAHILKRFVQIFILAEDTK